MLNAFKKVKTRKRIRDGRKIERRGGGGSRYHRTSRYISRLAKNFIGDGKGIAGWRRITRQRYAEFHFYVGPYISSPRTYLVSIIAPHTRCPLPLRSFIISTRLFITPVIFLIRTDQSLLPPSPLFPPRSRSKRGSKGEHHRSHLWAG